MEKICSLTVIIPAKDEENTLPVLLDCLESQTFKDFKIIVADASNGEGVKKICRERSIHCVDGGLPGKGRNNGAKHARSEYLLFLDADIKIDKNFILASLSMMKEKKAHTLSFGFVADTQNWILRFSHRIMKHYFFICTKVGFIHAIGGAILTKRQVHEAIGGFDETIAVLEDFEYCKRVAKKFRYRFAIRPLVKVSIRRFKDDGIFRLFIRYFLMELHRLFIGEIRHKKFSYFKE